MQQLWGSYGHEGICPEILHKKVGLGAGKRIYANEGTAHVFVLVIELWIVTYNFGSNI